MASPFGAPAIVTPFARGLPRLSRPSLDQRRAPPRSLADRERVAAAREHRHAGAGVDQLEVDVELRARRDGGDVTEQELARHPVLVGGDRLPGETLPEGKPRCTRALA